MLRLTSATLLCLGFALSAAGADDKIMLRESLRAGDAATVHLDFKAQGETWSRQADKKLTTYKFSANARIAYEERIVTADRSARKSLRYYTSSSLETAVDEHRTTRELRDHVRLMVAELRDGQPFLFSPSGPLTVQEYELVDSEAQLDSLAIDGLLPQQPVQLGDTWQPTDSAVAAVFSMSSVSSNELVAKLDSLDANIARISLNGKVSGVASSAPAQQIINGHMLFDRARSKIARIELVETHEREPCFVGPGLQMQTGLTFQRRFDAPLARLNDKSVETLPTEPNRATEHLVYLQPDGQYRFYFPRGWHVARHSPRGAVLRLVENDQLASECHVLTAPNVAPGSHMSPEEFRTQVQQALGEQFQKFIQEGEVPAPKGYWVYRLAAAGAIGNQPVVWYYHLTAGPQGQQLVFIFRIDADRIDQFAAKDLALVGSLEFEPVRTVSNPAATVK